jgi:hypothetical protein
MAAGVLLYPSFATETAKDDHYRLTQYIAARFRERMGSLYCHQLLSLPPVAQIPRSTERSAQFYEQRPCASAIVAAAEILEDVLQMAKDGTLAVHLTDEACAATTDFLNLPH